MVLLLWKYTVYSRISPKKLLCILGQYQIFFFLRGMFINAKRVSNFFSHKWCRAARNQWNVKRKRNLQDANISRNLTQTLPGRSGLLTTNPWRDRPKKYICLKTTELLRLTLILSYVKWTNSSPNSAFLKKNSLSLFHTHFASAICFLSDRNGISFIRHAWAHVGNDHDLETGYHLTCSTL